MKRFKFLFFLLVTMIIANCLSLGIIRGQARTSILNNRGKDPLLTVSESELEKDWFAIPVMHGGQGFNPVFLPFKYSCRTNNPDRQQPLTFPSLLSFKFDFVPDNFSARHPGFIFRSDRSIDNISISQTDQIVRYIDDWSATHAVTGELIQTATGYGGSVCVYDKNGRKVFVRQYEACFPYFTLMGKIVHDWMEYRKQPVSPGLDRELTRPMTKEMETVKWYGDSFKVKWRSEEEWDIYEKILNRDPGFGEVRFWYANQKAWETDDFKTALIEKGKSLMDHPVMSAVQEFNPESCPDQTINLNYKKLLSYLWEICPDNPGVCCSILESNYNQPEQKMQTFLRIAQKNPSYSPLLGRLAYAYRLRHQYEYSIPLFLSAVNSGFLPGDGSFGWEYYSAADEFYELGYFNESFTCIRNGYEVSSDARKSDLIYIYGLDLWETGDYSKAKECFLESYRTSPNQVKLFNGYLSLYEAGDTASIQQWSSDPGKNLSDVYGQAIVNAKQAVADGDAEKAFASMPNMPFQVNLKFYGLIGETEIVRADARLSDGDPRARQHAFNAWYVAPRKRRTSYLVLCVQENEKENNYRFLQAAHFIFPGQSYWSNKIKKLEKAGLKPETEEQVLAQYRQLIQQKKQATVGEPLDFWLKQPPFLVEYLCFKMAEMKKPSHQTEALSLFSDYSASMRRLSEYQMIHTQIIARQLQNRIQMIKRQ